MLLLLSLCATLASATTLRAPSRVLSAGGAGAGDRVPPEYLGLIKKASISHKGTFNLARERHLVLTCEDDGTSGADWHGTPTISWYAACARPAEGCAAEGNRAEGHAVLGSLVRRQAGEAAPVGAAAAESWRCGAVWGTVDGCPTSRNAAGRAACFCVPIEPPSGTATDQLRLDVPDELPAARNAPVQAGRQAALAARIVSFYRACALALHVSSQDEALKAASKGLVASDKLIAQMRPALEHCDAHRKSAERALVDVLAQCPQAAAEHRPLAIAPAAEQQQPAAAPLEYATLPLDCSQALLPPHWTVGIGRPAKPLYRAHLITCTYAAAGAPPPPPSAPGAPLPPVKVPVLVLYSEDGHTFVRAHAVAARGHESMDGSPAKLTVAGFSLLGAADPVGSAAAAASGELTTLQLAFRDPDKAQQVVAFGAALAAVRSVAAAIYICGGNTGRSPVAEALAADALGRAGLYSIAPVFSRLKDKAISSEGEFVEADVRRAVARLFPRDFRLLEHLDLHRARPSSGPALAFARVILTASEEHRGIIRALMAAHRAAEAAAAVRPALEAALPAVENVYTIKEWLDLSAADKTVADPFDKKNAPDEAIAAAAFEVMVEEMLKFVPPGALKAAHGLFPVDSVVKAAP